MRRTDHWLSQLKGTKLPAEHVVFDTEADVVRNGTVYEHKFRLAVTQQVSGTDDGWEPYDEPFGWDDPHELWEWLSTTAQGNGELHVWAHNLAYDLRVSNGLACLVDLGWDLEHISLVPQATWCAWKLGKAKLTCLDTMSWLPGPLEKVASDLDRNREHFNYDLADHAELMERCVEDTETLAIAVSRLLTYLKAEDLGHFRPTGSGQSHAALRRRFLPQRSIHVHVELPALVAEREAMHTGRCEAWRHGPIDCVLHEFDLNLAYCRIAAGCQVPGHLIGNRAALEWGELETLEPDYCILAEVDVVTETPIVPVTTDDGVIWPVGRFKTTLWDSELRMVARHAPDSQLGRAWLYRRTDALQSMCLWLMDRLGDGDERESALVRHMLKHWARTVVGRCGLRYRSWEWFGTHPRPELCISYEPNEDTGEVEQNMRIGRQMLQLAAMTESYSSVPSIPGWVASECRAELWRLIQQAGPENVYYMDTDGLLVNRAGARNLKLVAARPRRMALEYKGSHRQVVIHGPRNVELGEDRRLSGVPKRAIRLDELTFEGETWSGLEYALEAGRTDRVEVTRRKWEVTPTDKRRIHLEGGMTEPHRMETDATE